MEVLFTFGSAEHFPFQNGYVIINAANTLDATNEFRRLYPDEHAGVLNCSDIYTRQDDVDYFKNNGNRGQKCHRYIDIEQNKQKHRNDFTR